MKGWSAEEMKGKPSSSLEEDTVEMRKWREMSQDEDSKREAHKGRSAPL